SFFTKTLPEWIDRSWRWIQDAFAGAWRWIQDHIITPLWSALTTLGNWIKSGLETIYNFFTKTLPEWVSGLWKWLQDVFGGAWKWIQDHVITPLWNALATLGDWIKSGLSALADFFTKSLPGWIENIRNTLAELPKVAFESLRVAGLTLWDFMLRLRDAVLSGFSKVAETLKEASVVIERMGAAFMGFVNAVTMLPERIYGFFKPLADFFQLAWDRLKSFFDEFSKDPAGWFRKNIFDPLVGFLKTVRDVILGAFRDFAQWILGGLQAIGGLLAQTGSVIWQALQNFVGAIQGGVGGAMESFYRIIIDAIKGFADRAGDVVKSLFSSIAKDFYKAVGLGSPPGLTVENFLTAMGISMGLSVPLMLIPLVMEIPIRAVAFGLRGLALALRELRGKLVIHIRPLGFGGQIDFDVVSALGAALHNFAEELMKHADKFYEPFWLGLGFWYTRYWSLLLASYLRNYIPIEFPSYREVEEAYLRARVAERIPESLGRSSKDVHEAMISFLKMKGYSDYLLTWAFASPEEFYTTVKDRFGVSRKIPLADVWKTPGVFDVARMWIRDVLRPTGVGAEELLKNLTKVFEAAGYYRDIGVLYTLLAFRYPTPESLGKFYWRGIAGVLWLEDSFEEPEWRSALNIPWSAKAPAQLNYDAKTLNLMLTLYMRWHDYFPAAWYEGFPTDKAIEVELMASLPDKVDVRWMTRWGLFQHLADAGVSPSASLRDIFTAFSRLTGQETRRTKVEPKIEYDVRMLARLLIANRIHPFMAPIAAVAEAHTALTASFTLLRTGFIDALRRGFLDLDTAEALMSGLFVIDFKTAYIDPLTGSFNEIVYKKPIFWLPADRRILQLRSSFDRFNLLLRSAVTRLTAGVRYISFTSKEAIDRFRKLHEPIASHLSAMVKSLSGIDWRPAIDEGYVAVWSHLLDLEYEYGVRLWIRRYVARVMGWFLYRVAYGYVDKEKFEKGMDSLVEKGFISSREAEFFKSIYDILYGLVAKENIPTPSTLATLSEYVAIPKDLVDKVLENYKTPDEFRRIWAQYIYVKPFIDDARAVVSAYFRALRYSTHFIKVYGDRPEFKIPGEVAKDVESVMALINMSPEEKRIRELAVSLDVLIDLMRERVREIREWRPSILSLITITEYVPEAVDLISRYVIDPAFKPVIEKYARIKPLVDDARRAISTYYSALRYSTYYTRIYGKIPEFQIPEDITKSIENIMSLIGVTAEEKSIRELASSIEVQIDLMREKARELREWRPSLSMLITISEYVPEATNLLSKYVIDPEFKPVIEKYASRRPFADDARAAVNAFFRLKRYAELYKYQIPQDIIDSVNKLMEAIGMTDAEKSARELAAHIEYLIDYIRTEAREYVPTPSMLATISEYIALPPDLVKEALELRRVPSKWRDVWIKYISARTLADDVRTLLSAYMRAKRLGVSIPKDMEEFAKSVFEQAGLSDLELKIRETAASIDALIETYPSLSQLATMAEYIEVPVDYINKVLQMRKVEKTFADLWIRYVEARTIASEVNAVSSTFRMLFINFAVPDDLVKKVKDLMLLGGWTPRELQIFDFELELRRIYRTLTILIPSIRQ
ncbi:MAG: hypothetical protein C0179_08485, partial [Fervidicoccus sp.]